MSAETLGWITGLLRERNIPFLVCGGLAAIGYGSNRPLNDIDLFVPGENFEEIVTAGERFVSKPANHYYEEGWDLEYVQFKYKGIKIEVGNAQGARIFDSKANQWVNLVVDFSSCRNVLLFGVEAPLMNVVDLISYKEKLGRRVDWEDIEAMSKRV